MAAPTLLTKRAALSRAAGSGVRGQQYDAGVGDDSVVIVNVVDVAGRPGAPLY